jgi:bacillithiol biosynthesis deacetylase BshB1
MTEPLDILAIGAHPDDCEMTSGGLLALAASKGQRAGILHLTKGEMGTRGTVAERVREAEAAAKALSLSAMDFAGLEDGHVWCNEETVAKVVGFIRRWRPKIIVSHYPDCHHPDHEQAAQIVIRAVHFASKQKYTAPGQAHSIHALLHAKYSAEFEPSFYVDVSAVADKKLEAILCYHSQFKPKPGEPETRLSNPGFTAQLMARGVAFGLAAGCDHAEAYRSAGPLVVNNPLEFFTSQPVLGRLLR